MNIQPLRSHAAAQQRSCASREEQGAQVVPPVSAGETLGGVYRLEAPMRCPHCAKDITTIRVLRALRTQVSFTSTLPRKGYVIICTECTGMLSSALSGAI